MAAARFVIDAGRRALESPPARVGILAAVALMCGLALKSAADGNAAPLSYIFTEAPRYDADAWLEGHDRFPAGAVLRFVSGSVRRALAPELYASADANLSFDGKRALFSGKRTVDSHWQVWETALDNGRPRQITTGDSDCIRPLYLPEDRVAYTRLTSRESRIEIVPMGGGDPAPVTFANWRCLTDDVLRDGRILFEAERRSGATRVRELFTVYPDGTGVEALRCDHGPDRRDARQISSGDVVFNAGGRLARFTSALAAQASVAQPQGESAGPIAEERTDVWIFSRRGRDGNSGLYLWNTAAKEISPLEAPPNRYAVQPVAVAPRNAPRRFPSALVPTRTAGDLLCLDARAAKPPIDGAEIHSVRFFTQDPSGAEVLLGGTAVERDGSFYVEVPADRPLRLELLDAAGHVVRAEREWFWMRPSEQRVCVGCHLGPERSPDNKVPEVLLRTTTPDKMQGAGRH